jgi:hypothetical protein
LCVRLWRFGRRVLRSGWMIWIDVLDGSSKPLGWIRSEEASRVLEARSADYVGMSARYFKRQAKKKPE